MKLLEFKEKEKRKIVCHKCYNNYNIVAFERFRYDSKLEVLLPICERCVEEIQRKMAFC
jgi:hypothetical protein